MEKPFYIEYRLGDPTEFKGRTLPFGYYRATYTLSGDVPLAFEYSTDRHRWSKCGDFKDLAEFNGFFADRGLMKFERLEYVETVMYRGYHIPVFLDDYGQCFYCIFGNREIAFGSFQDDYESEVRALVDYEESRKMVNTIK